MLLISTMWLKLLDAAFILEEKDVFGFFELLLVSEKMFFGEEIEYLATIYF